MSTGLAVPTRRPRPADTDGELTELARGGDQRAVAELYRRHVPAARSTARYLLHAQQDVDDVVSEAFAGVLAAFRTGHGPRGNFRCYLMACVRNACHVRRKPVTLLDEEHLAGQADVRHASLEDPEKFVEADTVARAFASLSPRWQQALWLSEVEQRPAGEVGEYMHIAPNATAALTHRARQAFASAYLSEHVAVAASIECTEFGVRLGAYVRNSLRATERRDVDVHLASCANCSRAVEELGDINTSLRTLQAPGAGLGVGAAAAATAVLGGATSAGGMWAALAGAGVLAKVAVVALVAVPTIAIGVAVRDGSFAPAWSARASTAFATDLSAGSRGGAGPRIIGVGSAPTVGLGAPGDLAEAATSRVSPLDLRGLPSVPMFAAIADELPAGDEARAVGVDGGSMVGGVATGAATAGGVDAAGVGVASVSVRGVSAGGVSVGGVMLPGVSIPGLRVTPGVSLPAISLPGVSIPPIAIPSLPVSVIGLPTVSVPPVQLPLLSTPPVTLPGGLLPQLVPGLDISVPPVVVTPISPPPVIPLSLTVPAPTVPAPTVPAATVPEPAVTVPPVIVPPLVLPPISVPHLDLPIVTLPGLHP